MVSEAVAEKPFPKVDGRRERSVVSRRRIAQAMLELVREGETAPSAELVAERAKVGRRTVFRLFNDMESVYAEMQASILQQVLPLRDMPIEGATPAERLDRLIDRRVLLFEEIMPVKVAADIHRANSDFLTKQHHATVWLLREIMASVLEPDIQPETPLFEALDAVLSLDMWRRLRQDQRLSREAADAIIRQVAKALMD